MKRPVRAALVILAALAVASVAQAQFHPVRPPPRPMPVPMPLPRPMPPLVIPPMRPMPSFPTTPTPSFRPEIRPAPRVTPPREETNSQDDGGDDCEDRDGNALNDPDDCNDRGNVSASTANDAAAADPIGNTFDEAYDNGFNDDLANATVANAASEPAEPGWRPSWWMIVLGVVAALFLFGWISDAIRRR